MVPTYRDGDVLLVLRGRHPRAGQVAVVRLPEDAAGAPRPLAVKRVTGRDPDDPRRWWIDSDNAAEGVTSFDVGSLAEADVLAVAVGILWRRLG
jgi:phage repressor protein C with HTH and peptisase S24 domain